MTGDDSSASDEPAEDESTDRPAPSGGARAGVCRNKRRLFALILVAMLFVSLELLCYVVIAISPGSLHLDRATVRLEGYQVGAREVLAADRDALAVFDDQLGWRPNPRLSNEVSKINALGLRSGREYEARAAAGTLRVAAFGDSFVYGHEVAMADAWPTLVEAGDPTIEVLNFGVTGYGPDQAYLRFSAEAAAVHPDVVVWGVSPWNLRRLVNVFRPFLTKAPEFAVKPRYHLGTDGLTFVPQPVATLDAVQHFVEHPDDLRLIGEHDYFYDAWVFENPVHDWSASARLLTAVTIKIHRRFVSSDRILVGPRDEAVFNVESEAFGILEELMRRVATEAKALGATPAIMVIPDRFSLERLRRGVPPAESPLLEACNAAELVCWDVADAFAGSADAPLDGWFSPGGHYSPEGNAMVAAWVTARLEALR